MAGARPTSGSGLPAGLVPPLKVALARAVARMPRANALPGSLSYEPKWDGYRCVAIHDATGVTLGSRQGKKLAGYFPERTAALALELPPGCVVDGEAVIWAGGRLDFSALQQGLCAGPKTLLGLVRQTPASYVAFDVLAVAGHDARALPFSERRALLEELARAWEPPLSLSPATIGPITEPREVVAGLVLDGELRIVGRSTPLKTAAARELSRWLQPPRGAHPWPETVKGAALDRFNRHKEPVVLTLVKPVAVEVSADTAWSGRSFRHPLRVLPARPGLSAADIILPEMLRPHGRAPANTVEQ